MTNTKSIGSDQNRVFAVSIRALVPLCYWKLVTADYFLRPDCDICKNANHNILKWQFSSSLSLAKRRKKMNIKSNNRPLWSRITTIFVIVLQVLTVMPIQTASAATAGFASPGAFSNSALANAGYAFASDDQYAQSSLTNSGNNKKSAQYGNFGFDIPDDATINLIEVSIEGHGTKNWTVAVSK